MLVAREHHVRFHDKMLQRDPYLFCCIAHVLEFPVCRLPAPHPHPAVGIDEHCSGAEDLHAFFDPLPDLGNAFDTVNR